MAVFFPIQFVKATVFEICITLKDHFDFNNAVMFSCFISGLHLFMPDMFF